MDPGFIPEPVWREIGQLLTFLWGVVLFAVAFALTMMVGHLLIPSLVATRHLPEQFQRLRPLFTLAALGALAVAALFFAQAVARSFVIERFYPRWWF